MMGGGPRIAGFIFGRVSSGALPSRYSPALSCNSHCLGQLLQYAASPGTAYDMVCACVNDVRACGCFLTFRKMSHRWS